MDKKTQHTLPNGLILTQVTDETRLVSNIYCERPFCPADSRRFLYAVQANNGGAFDNTDWEFLLCEFGTWKIETIARGFLKGSVSYSDDYCFKRSLPKGGFEVARLDMNDGRVESLWKIPDHIPATGHLALSPNGHRLAFQHVISYHPQVFGISVVDLDDGKHRTVLEHPHVSNAHLQFCPVDNDVLLVQVNRGCEFSENGKRIKNVGPEGATLVLLDVNTGKIDPLQIGSPFTPPVTGHQAWLGRSREIIATVAARDNFVAAPGKGNTVAVTSNQSCRQLGTGIELNHIGATPCGLYFHGDMDWNDHVAVGSPATGKTVTIHSGIRKQKRSVFGQMSHPHAYLSPDFRWMVFNSDMTGRPQVYVAGIPSGFLEAALE